MYTQSEMRFHWLQSCGRSNSSATQVQPPCSPQKLFQGVRLAGSIICVLSTNEIRWRSACLPRCTFSRI